MLEDFKEYYHDLVLRSSFVRVLGEILAYIFPEHYSHFKNYESVGFLLLEVFVLCPIILVGIDYLANYVLNIRKNGKH